MTRLTQNWYWPLALLIIWGNALYGQADAYPCREISRKGSLHLKTFETSTIQELYLCTALTELSFRKSDIQEVPEFVWSLLQLESLNLSKTQIQRFPEGIGALENLKKLDLSFTNIYYLPPALAELEHLETLILRGTHINSLPSGLDRLQKIDMRMIDLSRDEQKSIRQKYPNVKIYFSSPCNCK